MSEKKSGSRSERGESHSGISAATAAYLERRAHAFAEATSRPPGKPPDGVTYGKGKPPAES